MKNIGARLAKLEAQQLPAAADLAQEAAQHGTLAWQTRSRRCYTQDTPDGARLAVVGGVRPLVYEVPGISIEDLR